MMQINLKNQNLQEIVVREIAPAQLKGIVVKVILAPGEAHPTHS